MHTFAITAVLGLLASSSLASTITAKAVPTLLRRQNNGAPSCSGFSSIESSCSLQTSNFVNLDFTVQASCLCSQSSTYDGSVYDGYFQTCLSYYATASPSFYSTELDGDSLPTAPCALFASAEGASVITSSAARATTTFDANGAACTSWDQLQEECSQRSSGFGNLGFSSEASCLCYTGSTWAPQIYDGYWGSCLSYFKTQTPALYSTWQSQNITNPTPCAVVGNVRNGPTLTAASTTANSTLARSSSSARASSGVTSSSSARSTTTSSSSIVLTTTGSATASRVSSAGNTRKIAAAGWMFTFVGAVAAAMAL